MAAKAAAKGASDTRQRLLDVAVTLFGQHSFAGTSLQMIADEMGITKAAVYHHFRTRDDLLTALVEPIMVELRLIIEQAEEKRTPHARAEYLLVRYAELSVRHRDLIAIGVIDRGVIEILRDRPKWWGLIRRQVALLTAVQPGLPGHLNATMVLAGLATAAGRSPLDDEGPVVQVDDEVLTRHLIDVGRRILGLRAPRRPHA